MFDRGDVAYYFIAASKMRNDKHENVPTLIGKSEIRSNSNRTNRCGIMSP